MRKGNSVDTYPSRDSRRPTSRWDDTQVLCPKMNLVWPVETGDYPVQIWIFIVSLEVKTTFYLFGKTRPSNFDNRATPARDSDNLQEVNDTYNGTLYPKPVRTPVFSVSL